MKFFYISTSRLLALVMSLGSATVLQAQGKRETLEVMAVAGLGKPSK